MNHTVKTKTPVFFAENGSILINVHIETSDEFYNDLDPSPEDQKDLDEGTPNSTLKMPLKTSLPKNGSMQKLSCT